jgi:hypothetical protein
MPLTREQRKLRAQTASHTSWSKTSDRRARTQAASDAFQKQFEDQVDPERKLPEAERKLRAESARKAHYARVAFIASKARTAAAARRRAARS